MPFNVDSEPARRGDLSGVIEANITDLRTIGDGVQADRVQLRADARITTLFES